MRAARYVRLGMFVLLSHVAAWPVHAEETARTPDCAAISTPDQKKDEDTIQRIEQGWLPAEYRGNPQFLDCLLEPDYRTSGRNGIVRTCKDVIDRVAQLTNMTREVPKLETIVFVHGDAAAARSILRTTDKTGIPKEIHFVDSYTFHDGRWHAYGGADL